MSQSTRRPLVENLYAPEVFATEPAAFSHGHGTVTITFSSWRFDNSTDPAVQKRVVIARLVMPTAGAQALAAGTLRLPEEGRTRSGSAAGRSAANPMSGPMSGFGAPSLQQPPSTSDAYPPPPGRAAGGPSA